MICTLCEHSGGNHNLRAKCDSQVLQVRIGHTGLALRTKARAVRAALLNTHWQIPVFFGSIRQRSNPRCSLNFVGKRKCVHTDWKSQALSVSAHLCLSLSHRQDIITAVLQCEVLHNTLGQVLLSYTWVLQDNTVLQCEVLHNTLGQVLLSYTWVIQDNTVLQCEVL